MIALFGVVIFLFAFASGRNDKRVISQPQVKFLGENNLFITSKAVSKLLIQNYGGVTNVPKEALALNELEQALKSNPMIKTAEVYVSVSGTLKADIEQKTPIARVSTNASYYIDADGLFMPLSNNYSARVPLVTGYVEKNNLNSVYQVALKTENDAFLKKHVFEIHQDEKAQLFLKLRKCNFLVQLGDVSALDKKINNLKAFYKKALKDQTLKNYSKVNLQFDNQVICTKI
ncbi:cell division protein FtsQ/DivIB [Pseudotamlana haliotis]|nr:cell division protein FtsQ/DivIB [Tamlana haliotis]